MILSEYFSVYSLVVTTSIVDENILDDDSLQLLCSVFPSNGTDSLLASNDLRFGNAKAGVEDLRDGVDARKPVGVTERDIPRLLPNNGVELRDGPAGVEDRDRGREG